MAARNEFMKRGLRGVPAFLVGDDVVVGLDTAKIENLIDYNVVECSNCPTKLRVPKGKGKLVVTCPKCESKFEMNT